MGRLPAFMLLRHNIHGAMAVCAETLIFSEVCVADSCVSRCACVPNAASSLKLLLAFCTFAACFWHDVQFGTRAFSGTARQVDVICPWWLEALPPGPVCQGAYRWDIAAQLGAFLC